MLSLRKSLLLVLLFNLITCHKHLLPKELMLVKEKGIDAMWVRLFSFLPTCCLLSGIAYSLYWSVLTLTNLDWRRGKSSLPCDSPWSSMGSMTSRTQWDRFMSRLVKQVHFIMLYLRMSRCSWIILVSSPSSTVRGGRFKRGIDWVETAGVAAIGIVSTIFYPVGAGIGAALGTMNAMKIADLDYKMRYVWTSLGIFFRYFTYHSLKHFSFRRIYALHMADKFAAELDRAFVSHELSGIVLAGLSKVSEGFKM